MRSAFFITASVKPVTNQGCGKLLLSEPSATCCLFDIMWINNLLCE
jgi:hypothetical protein